MFLLILARMWASKVSKCRTVWSCMEIQRCFSRALVQTHKSPLWVPPRARHIILQAIKSIYFNWKMTPIFESLENPSPSPFVSPVADFQCPDSSRAFCPPCSPPATRDQRPICCNEFNMFSLHRIVPGQPEKAPFRVTFH